MERLLVIFLSAAIALGFYFLCIILVRKSSVQKYILSHENLLHPNAICYWRTAIAFVAYLFYFFLGLQTLAIIIFSIAAVLDGVDGLVARSCDLVSEWGKWLDPMCDKLTYLPPMIGFAYIGILQPKLVWILVAIELVGQFLVRHVLALLKLSGAANNFGKIKAIICFALVVFCSLLDKKPDVINMGDEVLIACIVLASASIVFKFVPNRLYADILSTLNFFCGISSLYLTYQHHLVWAIMIIIMGQLFDLFDGRMAEKHGGTKYGPYLDDIADFISFGLAPAYIIIKSGGTVSWLFGFIFLCGVAFRLIRFLTVDKKRKDLPPGIFNGLPCPAGAMVVLGASLVASPNLLSAIAMISVGLMISNIQFAHLGRVMLKQIPKPVFIMTSSMITLSIAYIFKTKNVEMFGYLLSGAVLLYIITGRRKPASIQLPEAD
ncbi:MAG TPA: phosphatidylserine synthase [Desulfobacterales bacterium]|nr:phosphatidylserine synthase [Desulfobacterales bacterium]HIP40119.1 phosphatidylserine synthase [Desulfocapsa sulfexigens]